MNCWPKIKAKAERIFHFQYKQLLDRIFHSFLQQHQQEYYYFAAAKKK
jgi:hypothetical protein